MIRNVDVALGLSLGFICPDVPTSENCGPIRGMGEIFNDGRISSS